MNEDQGLPIAHAGFIRAAAVGAADIKAQIPVYLELITSGSVQVPFRTFPLSDVSAAWTASAETGPRVVLIRD